MAAPIRCTLRSTLQSRLPSQLLCRTYYDIGALEPFAPIPHRIPEFTTAHEAVKAIKSGDRVFVHGAAATPLPLIDALCSHGKNSGLKNVEIMHIHTEGKGKYNEPEYEGIFRSNSMFTGANARKAISEGRADFMPIFLSEIPSLFRRKVLELDVALIQVSPPDSHGFCSLGTSVDCTRAAVQNAKYIIGLANHNFPRTFGDGNVHYSHFDVMVHLDYPMPEHQPNKPTDEETKIGQFIARELVENGATLQMGIGAIPDSALAELKGHKNLGIHTEMFTDGVVDLTELGVITNVFKPVHTGKIVAGFVIGTKRTYNFVNNNPFVVMNDITFVNNEAIIASNPKMTAINSCIEIDLTGQVVSDSIGNRIYSGVGGQIDFLRGAAQGTDGRGKPILAMPSTTSKGESKIVKYIKEGAGVVTSRAHVHYVVTEYGVAYLFGKNLRQRAYALINIAHPKHREQLEKDAFDRLKVMPSPN